MDETLKAALALVEIAEKDFDHDLAHLSIWHEQGLAPDATGRWLLSLTTTDVEGGTLESYTRVIKDTP
jgi:hypothetical protein